MRLLFVSLVLAAAGPASPAVRPALADPADICAKIGTDDTVRPYEPSLRQGFAHAFKTLFPQARGAVSDAVLRDQGSYRCMDGRLLACFIGANLPCGKISVRRDNAAVERYCAATGTADFVPMYVSGHDSEFSYRCRGGHAEVAAENWVLDRRGFAAKLWAPMD